MTDARFLLMVSLLNARVHVTVACLHTPKLFVTLAKHKTCTLATVVQVSLNNCSCILLSEAIYIVHVHVHVLNFKYSQSIVPYRSIA